MSASAHTHAVFSAPAERCRRLNGVILRHVDPGAALSVLDIGCGTGTQIFNLAVEMPNASFVGVDISVSNIRIAESTREADANADRITFHNGDYMEFRATSPMDVIFSYSTLYLIPVERDRLFGKIAAELAPGGIFVNVMPVACAYNSALTFMRRAFRAFRGPITDKLILSGAKLMHGGRIADDALRERVAYMYEVPWCFDGVELQNLLAGNLGLDSVERMPEIHASPAQMKHSIHVFRKRKGLD